MGQGRDRHTGAGLIRDETVAVGLSNNEDRLWPAKAVLMCKHTQLQFQGMLHNLSVVMSPLMITASQTGWLEIGMVHSQLIQSPQNWESTGNACRKKHFVGHLVWVACSPHARWGRASFVLVGLLVWNADGLSYDFSELRLKGSSSVDHLEGLQP